MDEEWYLYQSIRYTCTCIKNPKQIIKYKTKEKLSWKRALPPEESLTSKDGTVLSVLQAHVYMNISHPSWVNTSV